MASMNFDEILQAIFQLKKTTAPIKVIVFCSPGIDSALMLLQLLGSKKYDVVGIVPVSGNVDISLAVSNTLSICEFVGKFNVKIYPGSIEKDETHHASIYGDEGLGSIRLLPAQTIRTESQNGINFIYEALQQDKHLLISTGILTEPARILEKFKIEHPEAFENIIAISMMGGVINPTQEANWPVSGERFSEANLAYDAKASETVFKIASQFNIPIFLSPLSLTHSILASKSDITKLKNLNTPAGKLAYQLIESVPLHYQKRYGLGPDQHFRQPLHDVHVTHSLTHPELYTGLWVKMNISSKIKPRQITITDENQGNIFLLDIHYLYREKFFDLLRNDLNY